MSATDSGQWPFGQRLAEQDARLNRKLGDLSTAIDQRMTDRADLLAMVRRMSHHLASVSLLDVAPEVKESALRMATEAKALIRRIER